MESEPKVQRGRVKFFIDNKGFGFILGREADIFFHMQVGRKVALAQNGAIIFMNQKTQRGPQADEELVYTVLRSADGLRAGRWGFADELPKVQPQKVTT